MTEVKGIHPQDSIFNSPAKTNYISKNQASEAEENHEVLMDNLEKLANRAGAPPSYFSKPVDTVLFQDAVDTVNESRKASHLPPLSQNICRRLFELISRIAQAVEDHIAAKKDENHHKKSKIEKETIGQISTTSKWQGTGYGVSAFAYPVLAILGVFVPPEMASALQAIGQSTQTVAQGADRYMDGSKTKDQFDMNFFMNNFTSDKQSQEGLKNLPEQMRHNASKLADILGSMYQKIGQRG